MLNRRLSLNLADAVVDYKLVGLVDVRKARLMMVGLGSVVM